MKNCVLNENDSKLWEKYKDYIYREEKKEKIIINFTKLIEEKNLQINDEVGEGWYTEGPNGWSCDKSPLKVCVYNNDFDSEDHYPEDCCYCGQPEERK